jgi:hypothetical protein
MLIIDDKAEQEMTDQMRINGHLNLAATARRNVPAFTPEKLSYSAITADSEAITCMAMTQKSASNSHVVLVKSSFDDKK